MIITRQKQLEDVLKALGEDPVFLIGCSECATLCHTGGEEEVLAMKETLVNKQIPVTGYVILDPACHFLNDKRLLKPYQDEIQKAKKILVLSCGNGVQTVSELLDQKEVISGTDTLFLGEIKHVNEFHRRCTLCGECLLDIFSGFCPVSRCPKSMLNGPCGGVRDGMCEINSDQDCVWDQIILSLKKNGNLHLLKKIQQPKDWSKALESRRNI